jgi:hypothetical protein
LQIAIEKNLFYKSINRLPAERNAKQLGFDSGHHVESQDELVCKLLGSASNEWGGIIYDHYLHDVSD